MPFGWKLLLTVAVIVTAARAGDHAPSLAGLIATMPLTGVLVLLWLYADRPEDPGRLARYAEGAFWGTLPSVLFFAAVWFAFKRGLPLPAAVGAGFSVWLVGAGLHRWLLG